jgi:hypothetical protein
VLHDRVDLEHIAWLLRVAARVPQARIAAELRPIEIGQGLACERERDAADLERIGRAVLVAAADGREVHTCRRRKGAELHHADHRYAREAVRGDDLRVLWRSILPHSLKDHRSRKGLQAVDDVLARRN